MRKVLLQAAGRAETVDDPIEVTIERAGDAIPPVHAVTVGERRVLVDLEATGPAAGWLRLEGRVASFRACRRGGTIEVWLDGRRSVFEIVERTARRAAEGGRRGMASDLTAPMPGKILRIGAAPGDAFEAHAALIVMESMKMEMTISAPDAGRVTEILCREGELVEMGEILARLEPLDAVVTAPDPA